MTYSADDTYAMHMKQLLRQAALQDTIAQLEAKIARIKAQAAPNGRDDEFLTQDARRYRRLRGLATQHDGDPPLVRIELRCLERNGYAAPLALDAAVDALCLPLDRQAATIGSRQALPGHALCSLMP